MKKVWIIVTSTTAILVVLSIFLLFSMFHYPNNFSDIRLIKTIEKNIQISNEIDFSKITDFKWDTMYFINDIYPGNQEIGELIRTEVRIRDIQDDRYKRIVFVNKGKFVKDFIFGDWDLFRFDFGQYGDCFSCRSDNAIFTVIPHKKSGLYMLVAKREVTVVNYDEKTMYNSPLDVR